MDCFIWFLFYFYNLQVNSFWLTTLALMILLYITSEEALKSVLIHIGKLRAWCHKTANYFKVVLPQLASILTGSIE